MVVKVLPVVFLDEYLIGKTDYVRLVVPSNLLAAMDCF